MQKESTDRLKLAAKFVNNTAAPIFLTGKAGTGKTTFLKELSRTTYKKMVIVAPTGIAALNAGGITIHSQFLFPLGFFLPVNEPEGTFSDKYGCFTQYTLNRKHPMSSLKRNVLKSIDLLVIDEVSMLRADILDAIDYRLRSAKRNYSTPFGGVQILMIGDLYQLPPIVRENEWSVLKNFYSSIHFFEAKVLKESGLVYLELDKIFRQKDDEFIQLLNNLRDNKVTKKDIGLLNSHYKSPGEVGKMRDCITLTTHNYKADQINRERLDAILKPSHYYEAHIQGDFPENLFPVAESLELREGAQVMFIKNDSSGSGDYFNGKLAQVEKLREDEIEVIFEGSHTPYSLKREVWENKKYVIDSQSKELEEEVVGTFAHFPIKLAWAVTVHKSQGLTFDRAIIDVGRAFAPGQVYVALSRLRSLEGLVLLSKIEDNVLFTDREVNQFVSQVSDATKLPALLKQSEENYLHHLVINGFDLEGLEKDFKAFLKKSKSSMEFEDPEMREAVPSIAKKLSEQVQIGKKFINQLRSLLVEQNIPMLQERLKKGSIYFKELLESELQSLLIHAAEVSRFTRTKTYLREMETLEISLLKKHSDISKIADVVDSILNGTESKKNEELDRERSRMLMRLRDKAKSLAEENPKFTSNKTGRKKGGKPNLKRKVGETYELTFGLIKEGKSIGDIIVTRGLAESTIKKHLVKGIKEGKVELEECLPLETISEINSEVESGKGPQELRRHFEDKYDYDTIRMVLAGRSFN
ncbi:helix-turn-helix domain-containing protein [Algoriphagus sediminis]|uniref:Helix-turn-helix domain-containing protein n=1 Tax=Algoriphagus sediminis TaxID=3057113 RepID=A0ABT7Y856_9BACT|nr:helix-turn-helix domain-containing protein [Algoriphagus sediminis]MDN3202692.1 helix-turn-helix domain-containing protein [Algoriphagus sediminis]